MKDVKPNFVISTFFAGLTVALTLASGTPIRAATPKTSGVYLSAADYKTGTLSFQGDCNSEAHRLELHDILNKSYIDVTHESEKRRYAKSELFGFRACSGKDYRFDSNLEYQILQSKELYIYGHTAYVREGKVTRAVKERYFSLGPDGQMFGLTLGNLKQVPQGNDKFRDLLEENFGAGQKLGEYDELHKMLKIEWLWNASRK